MSLQQLSLFSINELPPAPSPSLQIPSYGPSLPESDEIHKSKYRLDGENFEEAMTRVAGSLADNQKHFKEFREILLDMRFLPAGRIQAAAGNPRKVTFFNCFVIDKIEDSLCGKNGIMDRAKEAAQTMRMGGGVGYNFGSLRPRGDIIKKLQSKSSGPVSFMEIYDSVCRTIMSAGHRRGAQMGILPIFHPDIEEFIRAKQNTNRLTGFNISVAVTDKFMEHLASGKPFPLTFKGRTHKEVDPNMLWEELMRSTWDWAEPGVIFIDRVNDWNNLYYKETIWACNPCQEQPLPGNACCLLGSFNLVKYVRKQADGSFDFDWDQLIKDIPTVVRAMDNVTDKSIYPLEEQEDQQKSKRRMGIGVTGLANTLEALGFPYASIGFLGFQEQIFRTLTYNCYLASSRLAKEKGSFPLYDEEKYLAGKFIKTLPDYVRDEIKKNGIRNSHLTSIAPTGCQKGDTLIVTSSGIFELQELGDKTKIEKWQNLSTTVYNEFSSPKYADKWFSNGKRRTKKIVLSSGAELEVTPNHQFRVLRNGEYIWSRADSLNLTDYFVISLGSYKNPVSPHLQDILIKHGNDRETNFPKEVSEELAWFLGVYFGDGSNHDRGIRISLNALKNVSYKGQNKKEWEVVAEVGERLFNIKPTLDNHRPTCMSVCFNSMRLLDWLKENNFLKPKAQVIIIPKSIRSFSKDCLLAFLDGHCFADGYLAKNGSKTVDTVSKQFALQLQSIKRALGIDAVIHEHTSGMGSLMFRVRDLKRARLFFQKDKTLRTTLDSLKLTSNVLDTIRSIEDSECETFDISVPEGNTYIANGYVSHNTISFTADNVSSGIEPVFSYEIDRIVQEFDGPKQVTIQDYGYRVFGVKGRKANDCSADDHLNVLLKSQAYIDSSVSKTCNVSSDMPWEQFKDLYRKAWEGGAKGLSTYTNGGKRQGILKESSNNNNGIDGGLDTEILACYVDPSTGSKSCS